MALGFESFLPTPEGYATPEQIQEARSLSQALLSGKNDAPVKHWTGAVGNIIGALSGVLERRKANAMEQSRAASLAKGVPDYEGMSSPDYSGTEGTPATLDLNTSSLDALTGGGGQEAGGSSQDEMTRQRLTAQARAMSNSPDEFIRNLATLEQSHLSTSPEAPSETDEDAPVSEEGMPANALALSQETASDAPPIMPKGVELPKAPAPPPPTTPDVPAPKPQPEKAPDKMAFQPEPQQPQPRPQVDPDARTRAIYQRMRQHEQDLIRHHVPPAQAAIIAQKSAERYLSMQPAYEYDDFGRLVTKPKVGPPVIAPDSSRPGKYDPKTGTYLQYRGGKPSVVVIPDDEAPAAPQGAPQAVPGQVKPQAGGTPQGAPANAPTASSGVPGGTPAAGPAWKQYNDQALTEAPVGGDLPNVPRGNTLSERLSHPDRKKLNLDLAIDAGKEQNKAGAEDLKNRGTAANMARQLQPQLDDLARLAKNPDMEFGPGTDASANFQRMLLKANSYLGGSILKPEDVEKSENKVALIEQFNKLVEGGVLQSMRTFLPAGSGAIRMGEINMIQGAWPRTTMSRGGAQTVIEMISKLNQRSIDEHNMALDFAKRNGGKLDARFNSALAAYQDSNPVLLPNDIVRLNSIGKGKDRIDPISPPLTNGIGQGIKDFLVGKPNPAPQTAPPSARQTPGSRITPYKGIQIEQVD